MKTSVIQSVSILFLITSVVAHAEQAPSIAGIVKQRETALDQIVEYTKKQFLAGDVAQADVRNAQIELYTLHRDSAKTNQDRIQWQKQIVAAQKANYAELGEMTDQIALLKAKERYLAAKQKLLELQGVK